MTSSTEELAQKAEQALTFIKNHPDGIVQSELWKELGIDSRTCSRILKHLEDEGRIMRQAAKGNTFLVRWVKTDKKIDPMLIMAGDAILPCVACTEECDVPSCKMLEDWIYELVFAEME
ncbi:MAG TPA: MarR family transcriptional regulator [Methanocorpusculum sp.]|nr:MarR family transcriptional regulator [Methanocorpusculum sp.]HJJ77108.1 MarR family transcriptional regulator [Methanocorpusculum sp.]